MVQPKKDLLLEDEAVAAHADLKPINRVWELSGHDNDEVLLRSALLARQQAELSGAQRDGWVPPLPRLYTLSAVFAPLAEKDEAVTEQDQKLGTLSTATSTATAMDTDDGSSEVAAQAAAAAAAAEAACQEERQAELAAELAAAAAARQLRREQRRAEKDERRQRLLQVTQLWLTPLLHHLSPTLVRVFVGRRTQPSHFATAGHTPYHCRFWLPGALLCCTCIAAN